MICFLSLSSSCSRGCHVASRGTWAARHGLRRSTGVSAMIHFSMSRVLSQDRDYHFVFLAYPTLSSFWLSTRRTLLIRGCCVCVYLFFCFVFFLCFSSCISFRFNMLRMIATYINYRETLSTSIYIME